MRILVYLVYTLALFLTGCGDEEVVCLLGPACADHVEVEFVPEIGVTYHVTLVLDGEAGAFTCEPSDEYPEWTATNQTGIAETVFECEGSYFTIEAAPETVEINVSAENGSWNGSLTASPTYEPVFLDNPNCPICYRGYLTVTDNGDGHHGVGQVR